MTENLVRRRVSGKIIHECPICKSHDLEWSQYWINGKLEKYECTCLDCGHKGNWEEFYVNDTVYVDELCWVSKGLLYDIKDYLERVNDLGYLVLNCDDLIRKINEVLDK